jgi:hypothetical protein
MRSAVVIFAGIISIHLLAASSSFAQGKSTTQGRGLANAAQHAAAAATGLQTAGEAIGTAANDGGPDVFPTGQKSNEALVSAQRGAEQSQRDRHAWWRGADPSALSRANRGLEAPEVVGGTTESLLNFDRIRQHRLDQAAHLRESSARNGNQALLETADRMEASAEQNYLRQTEAHSLPPTGDIPTDETIPEVDESPAAGTGDSPEPAEEQVVSKRRRGFWIRSR